MPSIATRPAADVCRSLERIAEISIVAEAHTDLQGSDDCWERVGVVELERGIERLPPSVCRLIGQEDFGIERIERESGGGTRPVRLEVILR